MDTPTRRDGQMADPTDAPAGASSARAAPSRVGLGFGLAACAAAYRELLWFEPHRTLSEELEQFFFTPAQGVAPLVVLLAGWLLYRRVGRLARLPRSAGAPALGLGLLSAGALVHAWATLTSAPDLLVPSLALVGLGAAALWRGAAGVRGVLVPAAFLLFAMPLPAPLANEIVFRLQIATAELTGVLLTALRVPHHVAGEQILRTQQTFSVIESCSGLRSIETLAMVAVLMADLFRRPALHAWLLVLAAPPVAFFLNGWRAVALILNPHSQLAAVHNLQGIAILLGGLVVLFAFDGLLERVAGRRRREAGAAPGRPPGAASASSPGGVRHLAAVPALLALLALASAALPRFESPFPEPLDLSGRLGFELREIFAPELEIDRLFLGNARFRESASRRFRREGHPIDVFLGVGWRAGRGSSALSPKTALPGSGWILEAERRIELAPDRREVRSLLYRFETQRLLVYHWYEGALGLAVETARNLSAVDSSPFGRIPEVVVVRMATDVDAPVSSGMGPAAARLASFYGELRRVLDHLQEDDASAVGGKAFHEIPRREDFFLDRPAEISGRILVDQGLRAFSGLGMALAN